jgi:hypothetical protein
VLGVGIGRLLHRRRSIATGTVLVAAGAVLLVVALV